jgi:uncharacterized membrane protein (UPF0136 family)
MLGIMSGVPGRWSRPVRPPWSAVAGLGQVSWFLGNLYEAVVDMPQLLADAQPQRRPGLMSPGSPLRYYAPIAPLTLVATTAALIDSWCSGGDRRMIAAAAVNTVAAVGLTGYLVRTVNISLLAGAVPTDSSDRQRMLKRWHRANGIRLAAVAGAWLTLRRAARSAH